MLKQARHNGWRIAAGLVALVGVGPVPAQADAPLARPYLAECDGATEAPLALPPLPGVEQAIPGMLAEFQQAFDAVLTENILKAVGDATRLARVADKHRAGAPGDPFRVTGADTAFGPADKARLVTPTFGSRDLVAVSISPRLASASAFNTDIRFDHSSEWIDAGFDLAAQQSLTTTDPMAVRYDGRALVKVGPTVQLGVAARGSLGTLAAPTLNGNEVAGPLFHLNLIDQNVSLVSDLGYDFTLNPITTPVRNQFHAKLNFRLKL